YDIKVELSGQRIRCYLDGKLIHDETAREPNRFFALAGHDEARAELVLKTINAANEPVTAAIGLSGLKLNGTDARLMFLKAARGSHNNSVENPTRINPTISSLPIAANKFNYEFPPYSFTVMRMAAAIPARGPVANQRASNR